PPGNAAHLLESRSRSRSVSLDYDPECLHPDSGNLRSERTLSRIRTATLPTARFRAALASTGDDIRSGDRQLLLYQPLRRSGTTFPICPGFMNVTARIKRVLRCDTLKRDI